MDNLEGVDGKINQP